MKQQQSIKFFDDLTPEPAYQDVERVMDEAAQYEGDFIIAIGGGSVMDAAKLCSVLKRSFLYSERSFKRSGNCRETD